MSKKVSSSRNELLAKLKSINPASSIMGEDPTATISNYVNTGNYMLNAQISGSIYGGIPEGRVIVFAGDPGTGKTYIALNCCREAQKQYDTTIVWLDSEGTLDTEQVRRLGVDTDKFIYLEPRTIREASRFILTILESASGANPMEYMIVLDSLSNLSSEKELNDLLSGEVKRDMTKQQDVKAMFRTITTPLRRARIPMIACAHVYSSIGAYIPTKTISGGTGQEFGASTICMFSKYSLKKENDKINEEADNEVKKTGVIIKSVLHKSRYTKAGIDVIMHVSWYSGMNRFVGLQKFLNWDDCGVGPGRLEEEIAIVTNERGKEKKVRTGNMVYKKEEVAEIEKAKYWSIKSLGISIKNKDFWKYRKHIFTPENLQMMDVKHIQPVFKFKDFKDDSDIDDTLNLLFDDGKSISKEVDDDDDDNVVETETVDVDPATLEMFEV